jgi:hypothetical protein
MMKPVNDYNVKVLHHLHAKVAELRRLQQHILMHLPMELQPYCRVANFHAGELKLAVASSAWAMRLRYIIPELLQTLNKNGLLEVQTIHYYIEAEFTKLFA